MAQFTRLFLFFLAASSLCATQLTAEEALTLADTLNDFVEAPGCDTCGTGSSECSPMASWSAGFDFVFARPQFEGNRAFTTMESDGASFESFSDTEFGYDFQLAPRVWLGCEGVSGLGIRTAYWQFDQASATAVGSPPANGFGQITHPVFGAVDISTTIPGDTFTANSGLDAYTLDFEATKSGQFCNWDVLASAGIRYASIDQDYFAQLRNAAGTLQGEIDFSHQVYGIGPTFALETRRPLSGQLAAFGNLRGSILFGDASSELNAGEDLDLLTPFRTTRTTARHDILPIGEVQIGVDWRTAPSDFGEFFFRGAFEGQLWSGVGNATSEDGNLGFVGLTVGVGLTR